MVVWSIGIGQKEFELQYHSNYGPSGFSNWDIGLLDTSLFRVLSDSNYGVVCTPVIRTKSIWTPFSEQVMIQKKLGL
jgi:hypothetical protein